MCERCIAGFDYLANGGPAQALATMKKFEEFAEKASDVVSGKVEKLEMTLVITHGELLAFWFLFTMAAGNAPSKKIQDGCAEMRQMVGVMLDALEGGESVVDTELSRGTLHMENLGKLNVEGDLDFLADSEDWKLDTDGPTLH